MFFLGDLRNNDPTVKAMQVQKCMYAQLHFLHILKYLCAMGLKFMIKSIRLKMKMLATFKWT